MRNSRYIISNGNVLKYDLVKVQVILACLMMSYHVTTEAAVIIQAPEEIKVSAINQQAIQHGLFSPTKKYQSDIGVQRITLSYNAFFQHSDNTHDIVKSDSIGLYTPFLNEGVYQLSLINPPKNFEEAKRYKLQPKFALYDTQQKRMLEMTVDTSKLHFSQPKNYKIIENNQQNGLDTSRLDQQLIHLWKQASDIEKQNFMQWLESQK